MKDVRFVNPDELETLEQYAAALLSSMISLKTLEQFHIAAHAKGLLKEDEEETSKTICWEIKRLLQLYRTQVDNIMERAPIDETNVIESLRSMMPEVKIPRKRKYTKKNKDGETTHKSD